MQEFWNVKLPSITGVIKATEREEKRRALERWKARVGEEEAERIRQHAINRGNRFHKMIEEYMRTGMSGSKALDHYLNTKLEIESVEKPLWSHELGYKGIRDCRAYHRELQQVVNIDWKTATKPAQERYLVDEFQQLAAYTGLEPAESGMIIRFVESHNVPQEFWRSKSELREDYRAFRERLRVYYRNKEKVGT